MKKFFVGLFLLGLSMSGCGSVEEDIDINNLEMGEMEVEVVGLVLADHRASEQSDYVKLAFDFQLNRPEPRLIYVSGIDDKVRNSGMICNSSSLTQRCEVSLDTATLAEGEADYLVKVVFEDDVYAEKEVHLEIPETLGKPEMVNFADISANLSDLDTLDMKFIDSGADKYNIEVRLCRQYNDDGINPCLDGSSYTLIREKGVLDFGLMSMEQEDLEFPQMEVSDEVIHLWSNLELQFEESLQFYINASKVEEENGLKIYRETSEFREFAKAE